MLRSPAQALEPGFRAYLVTQAGERSAHDAYVLSPAMQHLAAGDVVRVDPGRSHISAIYRRRSRTNSLLVTERCDNFCLMCSQPPKEADDSWLLDELQKVIPLMSRETGEIGITGGEPGLLGGRLVDLVETLRSHLPETSVHILSNGRAFKDAALARALGKVKHPDLMVGVPIYSDLPEEHDYIVQASGGFTEAIRGILNLKRYGVAVELRFVVHAETWRRLPAFAEFVARNLLFVDHVALMGLELMGFAKTNLEALWIDPVDYQSELVVAARTLERTGMSVSIYNHQLCVLDTRVHHLARKSISDWKNMYVEECGGCAAKDACGGFFASATLRRSAHIRPLDAEGGR